MTVPMEIISIAPIPTSSGISGFMIISSFYETPTLATDSPLRG